MTRACSNCPATLGPKNKSGRCRACCARAMNADPEMQARRVAALAAYHATPEAKKGARRRMIAFNRNVPEDVRRRRSEHGRWLAANVLTRPDVRAKAQTPEARRQRGQSNTETRLGWCPPERRDEYRALVRTNIGAAEARRIIEAEVHGTLEHGRRLIANITDAQRIRRERERQQEY